MKKLFSSLLIPFVLMFLFSGCFNTMKSQKNQCIEQGLKYKQEKRLNYRTGEYEIKLVCIKP